MDIDFCYVRVTANGDADPLRCLQTLPCSDLRALRQHGFHAEKLEKSPVSIKLKS